MTQGICWQSSGENSALPCREHGFNPWLGNKDPANHVVQLEKKRQMNLSMKQTQGHRGQTCGCQGGRDWKRDRLGGWGWQM